MQPPPKLYKIGEVIRHSDFSRQTLHNYTQMGLIEPADRTDAGHRLYPPDVFERLEKIKLLKRHRTLREVKQILNENGENILSEALSGSDSSDESDGGGS